jgi:hypothetical protein
MVRHGPAYSLITAILLDVCNPLLTLRHNLNSFQVKMLVYNLKKTQMNKMHLQSEFKRQGMWHYKNTRTKQKKNYRDCIFFSAHKIYLCGLSMISRKESGS